MYIIFLTKMKVEHKKYITQNKRLQTNYETLQYNTIHKGQDNSIYHKQYKDSTRHQQ